MFSASADFPIDGRAAMMIRLPGWKPDVSLSSSLKPVGMPVTSAPASYRCMIRSKLSFSRPSMWLKSLVTRCWARSKTICSARSTRSVGLARPLLPEPGDLRPGPDEAAQRRHLAHDPRVVRGVRGRRDERRELVDPRAAADLLELAALLERVDERDRVDRLALLVEREAGAVDGAVALAVEVLGGEDLGDRADRARARSASRRAPTPRPRGSAAGRAAMAVSARRWAQLEDLGATWAMASIKPSAATRDAGRTEHMFEPYPQVRTTFRRQPTANARSQREVRAAVHSVWTALWTTAGSA